MKDRLTFLYFLFQETTIKEVAEVRVYNDEYDTSRIIGFNAFARKEHLASVYNKYVHILPIEIPNKKKSNFTMRRI